MSRKYTVRAKEAHSIMEVEGDYAIIDGIPYIFQAYGTGKSCDCIEPSECGCPKDAIECDGEPVEVDPESVRFIELDNSKRI